MLNLTGLALRLLRPNLGTLKLWFKLRLLEQALYYVPTRKGTGDSSRSIRLGNARREPTNLSRIL